MVDFLIIFTIHQYGQCNTWSLSLPHKIGKKKGTADNISNYLCNMGPHNIDNDSIIETLKEMQNTGLINKLYRPT